MILDCHRPSVTSKIVSRGVNPWVVLGERDHIVFALRRLPDGVEGVYWPRGNRAALIIDDRLSQVERKAALLHELIHDERGGGAEGQYINDDERSVSREVARRLVPLTMLARYVDSVIEMGEPVHAVAVAEEFDVDVDTANRALWLLEQRQAG